MPERLLAVVVVIGSGVTTGVLFSVALSVVPAFRALPPSSYVRLHQLVGQHYDRVMPPIVVLSTVVCAALAISGAGGTSRWLFSTGAACLLGVSLVSQFGNVPINRRVKALDPASVPPDWTDPRTTWQTWHLLRTVLAACALASTGWAVIQMP